MQTLNKMATRQPLLATGGNDWLLTYLPGPSNIILGQEPIVKGILRLQVEVWLLTAQANEAKGFPGKPFPSFHFEGNETWSELVWTCLSDRQPSVLWTISTSHQLVDGVHQYFQGFHPVPTSAGFCSSTVPAPC